MLAEPRRKHRIGPNPRGKFFTEDDDNRGRQMLVKMGWKTGDGLGANCHGMSEPIKPKVNTESRGLGYDRKEDPWVAHNEEFEQLLKTLNSNSSDDDGSQGREAIIRENVSASSKDALEEKSKGSKSRIHYHKFVKNKDLSRASFKDMSCIFGKSLDPVVQLLPTSVMDNDELLEPKVNGKNSEIVSPSEVITEEINTPEESAEGKKKKKKKKRKKNKETDESDETQSPCLEDQNIQLEKAMDEPEDILKSERKSKKKKRKQRELVGVPDIENNCNGDNEIEEIHTESISDNDKQYDGSDTDGKIRKKKKKSKKRKRDDDEAQNEMFQNISETSETTAALDVIEPESSGNPAASEEPETKRKKKKKSKKAHREEISEEMAISTPNIESDLGAPPHKEAEPNKDTTPPEKVETLGSMQFINRGSIVDYFRNKKLQMLNRISANSLKIA